MRFAQMSIPHDLCLISRVRARVRVHIGSHSPAFQQPINENAAAHNCERHAPRPRHLGNTVFRNEELHLRAKGSMGNVDVVIFGVVVVVDVFCFCLPWWGKVGGYESEESRVGG